MRKLLCLVLALMLCLPAFACAAGARSDAVKLVGEINEVLSWLEEGSARMQYTEIISDEANKIVYSGDNYLSLCQLCYTDSGDAVESVYLLSEDMTAVIMNSTVIYTLARSHFGAEESIGDWITQNLIEVAGEVGKGEEIVRRTYQLDGAEVCILGVNQDGTEAYFCELIAEDRIPVT